MFILDQGNAVVIVFALPFKTNNSMFSFRNGFEVLSREDKDREMQDLSPFPVPAKLSIGVC